MVILALGVLSIFAWNFPAQRDFTYRFRHGAGIGLESVTVSFEKEGSAYNKTVFYYNRGPDKGPVSQDHTHRLPPGNYTVSFELRYMDGTITNYEFSVIVERLKFHYILDIEPLKTDKKDALEGK